MALRCIVTTVSSSRALLGLSMTCILACSGCFNDEFSDARTEPIWDDRELIERIGSYELESIDATLIVEEIEGMLSMRLKSNDLSHVRFQCSSEYPPPMVGVVEPEFKFALVQ